MNEDEMRLKFNSLEKRLQATTEIVEFLEVRIKKLENKLINQSGVFKSRIKAKERFICPECNEIIKVNLK